VGLISKRGEHILAALGLPFIPPEERETPVLSLYDPKLNRYFEHFKQYQKSLLFGGR